MDNCTVSGFEHFINKITMNIEHMYKSFSVYQFNFLLVKYLEVKLLHLMGNAYLSLYETGKLFYTLTSNV